MTQEQQFDRLKEKIHERFPDAKIKYKNESKFWRMLPRRLRTAGTTINHTIWMPNRDKNFAMLSHEYVHLFDIYEMGWIPFLAKYTFPQWLFLLAVLVVIIAGIAGAAAVSIVSAIVGFLCLAPWPSKSRLELELRGYTMSLFQAKLRGYDSQECRKNIIDALRSWLYYKMVWSMIDAAEAVNNIAYMLPVVGDMDAVFKDVQEILNEKADIRRSR